MSLAPPLRRRIVTFFSDVLCARYLHSSGATRRGKLCPQRWNAAEESTRLPSLQRLPWNQAVVEICQNTFSRKSVRIDVSLRITSKSRLAMQRHHRDGCRRTKNFLFWGWDSDWHHSHFPLHARYFPETAQTIHSVNCHCFDFGESEHMIPKLKKRVTIFSEFPCSAHSHFLQSQQRRYLENTLE
jgi:hypothetical protein